MGTVGSRLNPFRSRNDQLPAMICGLDGAGKTTLLYKLKHAHLNQIPTIGFCVEVILTRHLSLTVIDLSHPAAQEKIRPLWRHYFRGINGRLILMVDASQPDTFPLAGIAIKKLLEDVLADADVKPEHISVLLLLNKYDLPTAQPQEQVLLGLQLHEFPLPADRILVARCAAITGDGIFEATDGIAAVWHRSSALPSNQLSTVSGLSLASTILESAQQQQQQQQQNTSSDETKTPIHTATTTTSDHSSSTPLIIPLVARLPASTFCPLPAPPASAPPPPSFPEPDASLLSLSELSDTQLLNAFLKCTLPLSLWTHRHRLRVVWLFLRYYGLDRYQTPLFAAWQRYKEALGHEHFFHFTLTKFWALMVAEATLQFWQRRQSEPDQKCNEPDVSLRGVTLLNHLKTGCAQSMMTPTTDRSSNVRCAGLVLLSLDEVVARDLEALQQRSDVSSSNNSSNDNNNNGRALSSSMTWYLDSNFDQIYDADLPSSVVLRSGQLFREYYSHERILIDPTSRREWVEPDLKPLPFLNY